MSIYLGQLGRLVELKCPASQQVTPEERYTFQTTLEGRQKARVRPAGRRVWSLATSDATDPKAQGALLSFANGEWGPGPFVFVSADAPVTNLFSPDAAACRRSENPSVIIGDGGPMQLPDGWSGGSYLSPQPSLRMFFGVKENNLTEPGQRLPILPGQPVTGGAYVLGAGAYAEVVFYDAADQSIQSVPSPLRATAGTSVRSLVTATPPPGAISCRVIARDTVQGSRPSLTWTDRPFDWAAGEGCPKAVIHGMSKSLVMASRDPRGGRYANLSFMVTEVG